jgi:hypothetical protein
MDYLLANEELKEVLATLKGEEGCQMRKGSMIITDVRSRIPSPPFQSFGEYLPTVEPDVHDGALPEQIDRRVCQGLGRHILP